MESDGSRKPYSEIPPRNLNHFSDTYYSLKPSKMEVNLTTPLMGLCHVQGRSALNMELGHYEVSRSDLRLIFAHCAPAGRLLIEGEFCLQRNLSA